MFHASSRGDLDLIRYHLDLDVDVNYQHPEYLTTALSETIRRKHVEACRYLLSRGADPRLADLLTGSTPMDTALEHQRLEIIDVLLCEGYLEANELPTICIVEGKVGDVNGKTFIRFVVERGYRVILLGSNSQDTESWRRETGNPRVFASKRECRDVDILATVNFNSNHLEEAESCSDKEIRVVARAPVGDEKTIVLPTVVYNYSWWSLKSRARAETELRETIFSLCLENSPKGRFYAYNHVAESTKDDMFAFSSL